MSEAVQEITSMDLWIFENPHVGMANTVAVCTHWIQELPYLDHEREVANRQLQTLTLSQARLRHNPILARLVDTPIFREDVLRFFKTLPLPQRMRQAPTLLARQMILFFASRQRHLSNHNRTTGRRTTANDASSAYTELTKYVTAHYQDLVSVMRWQHTTSLLATTMVKKLKYYRLDRGI